MLEYTYNSLMEEYSRINSLLIYDEMSRYISENIVDLSYTFDSIFTEEGEDDSEDDDEQEDSSDETAVTTTDNSTKEVSTSSSFNLKGNTKKLDTRKWYQKVWDAIVFGWRWIIRNIKRLFLKLMGKDLQKVYFINAPLINKRIDSLMEQIKNRNSGNNLQNKNDIKRIKEIAKALAEEVKANYDPIRLNETEIVIDKAPNKNAIKNAIQNTIAVLNSIDEEQKYCEKIASTDNGNELYEAYMKYLIHIKLLTTSRIVSSYQAQNRRITSSYYRIAGIVDIILKGFSIFEKAASESETGTKVSHDDIKLFLNAFGIGNATENKEEIKKHITLLFNWAKMSTAIKLIYVYILRLTEGNIDELTKADKDTISSLELLNSKDMIAFAKSSKEFEDLLKNYITNSKHQDESILYQTDISGNQKTLEDNENRIKEIDSLFKDVNIDQKWNQKLLSWLTKNSAGANQGRMNSLVDLLMNVNKAAMGVIKLSVISSRIDERLKYLIDIQEM